MKKSDLMNFAKFIFRSGEESFKQNKNILLDSEIQKYILDAFKDYQDSLKNKTKKYNEEEKHAQYSAYKIYDCHGRGEFVEPIELEEAQDVIELIEE